MRKIQLFVLLILGVCNVSFAQNILTLEDAILGSRTKFAPKSLNQLQWQGEMNKFTFVKNSTLFQGNVENDSIVSLLHISDLNIALINYDSITLKRFPKILWKNSEQLEYVENNNLFIYNISTGLFDVIINYPEGADNIDVCEANNMLAYTIGNNLFININGELIKVTDEDNPGIISGQTVHRNEFGITGGTFWSPEGKFLAYYRKDETMVADYPLVDISGRIAILENIKYPMAGMKSEEVTLWIYNIEKGTKTMIQTGEPKEQYLTNIAWSPDEKYIYIAVLNRGQDHMKLNQYDANSGDLVNTLFEETNSRYVEPLHAIEFMKNDEKKFIWQSNRDGYNHLYLYDTNGKLLNQLTQGEFDVTENMGTDKEGKFLYFISTQPDPIERQLYKLDLETHEVIRLTINKGIHNAVISQTGEYIIDTYSNISEPRIINLLSVEGNVIRNLITADNPYQNYKLGEITLSSVKCSDGKTDLDYRLIRPVDFDPSNKYPVIIYVYGGPHSQLVTNRWLGGSRMWQHYMAQKGFIGFTMDNRGTLGHGFDFESCIHRQLGKLEMEDQMKGVEFLKSLPYVDTSRIGIHGWSYGGFMTVYLKLHYPEIFKVAVAGGPVIDWKYYEVMYGERYMDTPQENPDGYEQANMKNYVDNLKGELLIIQGTMDPVVVWQNSLTFVQECVDRKKQIDYFIYPGHPHNVRGVDRVHLMRKVSEYFIDNL
ncbi:MAG: S9 family peptidase [Bacteroidales bacterium]|nr:S9 family peptidase [Bacteroidales bacterium]